MPTELEEQEYLEEQEEQDQEVARKLRADLEDAQFPSLSAVARPKLPPPSKKKKKRPAHARVTDSLASIGGFACKRVGKMINFLFKESSL